MKTRATAEIESFGPLWSGGYYEGDPLRPLAKSGYGQLGFMSVLYATYLRCIKPYINHETVALEIGPGRGTWTRALLPAEEVYVLDALPEEHNGFFQYLGYPRNVRYFQVSDFRCSVLPDDHFDYMFSFGCLCHVSFAGIQEYAVNVFQKLKAGANCFWMIADYAKYNRAIADLNNLSVWSALQPTRQRYAPIKWLFAYLMKRGQPIPKEMDQNNEPFPGRWYHAGAERTCSMLREVGYEVVDEDVGTCLRDPIIHFMKGS